MNEKVAKCLLVSKVLVADGIMTDDERGFLEAMMAAEGLDADERRRVIDLEGWDQAEQLVRGLAIEQRRGAAQALGDAGRPDATALLRFKVLLGDSEPAVLSACLEAMFALSRDASYGFVVKLLAAHDERAEVAALALGGARFAAAVDALTTWCVGATSEQRHRIGYLSLALLRAEPATAYLLDAIRSHGRRDAVAAARALATFKDDAAMVERIRAAAGEQRDPAARDEIAELLR